MLSAGTFRYFAIEGRPVKKIRTDAMMNGDHPVSTVVAECCVPRVPDTAVAAAFEGRPGIDAPGEGIGDPPPIGITTGGFQILRNATIWSSEKIADTISTSPGSWKLDQ